MNINDLVIRFKDGRVYIIKEVKELYDPIRKQTNIRYIIVDTETNEEFNVGTKDIELAS